MNTTIRLVSTNRAAVERYGVVYRVNYDSAYEVVAIATHNGPKVRVFPQERCPKLWADVQAAITKLGEKQ